MLEQYSPNEYYICKPPCGNITFATGEVVTCSCCGRKIRFSKTELPKSIGYPMSRRQWGERTPILSVTLKYTTVNWQTLPSEKLP